MMNLKIMLKPNSLRIHGVNISIHIKNRIIKVVN